MKLKLLKFIVDNPDWELLLQEEPYFIRISRADNFIMFKYGIGADFNNEIVRECRGIILDDKFNTVCVPFFKFGNWNEPYIPQIDWKNCYAFEKIDGSLIKVWNYNGKWIISTNGTIYANNASVIYGTKSYEQLFLEALANNGFKQLDDFTKQLSAENTYMFELVAPENIIVVKYPQADVYHLATRNNSTLLELDYVILSIKRPKRYSLSSVEDVIANAEKLTDYQEGFVVCDNSYNRLKVKSSAYVRVHHLMSKLSLNNSLEVVLKEETDEVLSVLPHYAEYFNKVKRALDNVLDDIQFDWDNIKDICFDTQKDLALHIVDFKHKSYIFTKKKNEKYTPKQHFERLVQRKQLELIQEYFEENS